MDKIRCGIEFIGILFGILGAYIVFIYLYNTFIFKSFGIWMLQLVPITAITGFSIGILNKKEWARVGFLWSLLFCFPVLAWPLIQLGGDWDTGVLTVLIFLVPPVMISGIFLILPKVKKRFN